MILDTPSVRQYNRRGLGGVRDIFGSLYTVVDTGFYTPCWKWNGKPSTAGYGVVGYEGRGRKRYAHRVSWQIHNGDIPDGKWVLHLCDVRMCVNPAHLFLGTGRDNAIDRESKGRGNHPVGSRTHNAAITESLALEIRYLYASGKRTLAEISEAYDVSVSCVDSVVTGRTWNHVNGPITTKSPHSLRGKINADDVAEIRSLKGVMTQSDIAKKFSIDPSHVSRILSGDVWRRHHA